MARDFFSELKAVEGLDPSKSRKENYDRLCTRYERVRDRHSGPGRLEQALLAEALEVFADEARYQAYLREWRAEGKKTRSGSAKASAEAERRAEEAHQRAQEAEKARRREAERSKALERELEAQRRRTEEAEKQRKLEEQRQRNEEEERAKQESPSEGKAGWLDLFLGVAKALTENKPSPPTSPSTYRPQALDLSGDWLTPDGFRCRIAQDGNRVRMQAWDQWGRFIADSVGGFDGNLVQVQFHTVPMPTPWGIRPTQGVARYQVLYGGRMLQGQIVNHVTGSVTNIQLQRAS